MAGSIGSMAMLMVQPAIAQVPITSLNATYQNGTSSTYSTTVADPCNTSSYSSGCGSAITLEFGAGSTDDLAVTGFQAGSQSFSLIQLADQLKFQRIDGNGAVGERQLVFFETVGSSNQQIRSTYVDDMTTAMLSRISNRGIDNAFSNDNSVASNNVERIDYIVSSGLSVPSANLGDIGFLILERGGNDPFKIAAITALDSNGNPSAFGQVVSVDSSVWGYSGYNIRTAVMRREESETNFRPSHLVSSQPVDGVYISVSDLGVAANQKIYGYALFPNDISSSLTNNDLVNLTNFPTTTSGASGEGGLDLVAGGGIYLRNGTLRPPTLDLDGDDSSGKTGRDYQSVYTLGGAAIAIADTDTLPADSDSTELQSATIVLTNARPGDQLTIDLSSLPSGVALDPSSTATQIRLQGLASLADYAAAIELVRFETTAADMSDRILNVKVTDDTGLASNEAISTLKIAAASSGEPKVLLVKRITAINGDHNTLEGDALDGYVNESGYPSDNASNPWPTPIESYLLGGIDGGSVMPGDEIEYTIYFLSNGEVNAENVLLCDYIPTHTTFVPQAFNQSFSADPSGLPTGDRGIVLSQGNQTVALTNLADGDGGHYFPPGIDPATTFPGIDCEGDGNSHNRNINGAVVIDLGTLPYATSVSPAPAPASYGFVRFRGRVK
ncbi:hypothetical protein [Almyronema epifaneia]|uniref:DUF11 domain-containing protein n=1 Tax=Almyronema epifaneia S1 TaxID=2991925 RepID=A0ABW6IH66_9CYAN